MVTTEPSPGVVRITCNTELAYKGLIKEAVIIKCKAQDLRSKKGKGNGRNQQGATVKFPIPWSPVRPFSQAWSQLAAVIVHVFSQRRLAAIYLWWGAWLPNTWAYPGHRGVHRGTPVLSYTAAGFCTNLPCTVQTSSPEGPLLHGWVEMAEAWQAEVTQGSSLTQWERKLTSRSMRQKRSGLALHQLYHRLRNPQPPAPQYGLDRQPSGRKKNNQIIGTQWHHWPHDVLNNTHSVTVFKPRDDQYCLSGLQGCRTNNSFKCSSASSTSGFPAESGHTAAKKAKSLSLWELLIQHSWFC